jgi:hypothetical protein
MVIVVGLAFLSPFGSERGNPVVGFSEIVAPLGIRCSIASSSMGGMASMGFAAFRCSAGGAGLGITAMMANTA